MDCGVGVERGGGETVEGDRGAVTPHIGGSGMDESLSRHLHESTSESICRLDVRGSSSLCRQGCRESRGNRRRRGEKSNINALRSAETSSVDEKRDTASLTNGCG